MKVRPTHLEFIRLKRRHEIVKKARKILRDKLNAQLAEIVRIWRTAYALRKQLEVSINAPYGALAEKVALMGEQEFRSKINFLKEFSSMEIKEKKLFNIYVPEFKLTIGERNNSDLPLGLQKETTGLREDAIKVLSVLVSMSEYEESIRQLIDEVRNTKIKSNAIEKIVLPKLEKDLDYIKKSLEEKDREEKTRLKRVKELVGVV